MTSIVEQRLVPCVPGTLRFGWLRLIILGFVVMLLVGCKLAPPRLKYRGAYLGVAAGFGTYTSELDDEVEDKITSEFSIDEPLSYSVRLGYRFSDYWAVEAGYVHIGEAEIEVSGLTNETTIEGDLIMAYLKAYPWSADFSALGYKYPNGCEFYLSSGFGVAKFDVDDDLLLGFESGSAEFAARAGIGLDLFIIPKVAFTLEYAYSFPTGDWESFDHSETSIGILVQF